MMHNKKGLDFIDWTLSMGLFLVVVIGLFVFLKPGAQPAYEGDNLIKIVEQNFLKETGVAIRETPLFIAKLHDQYGANLEAEIEIKVNADWKFKKVSPDPATKQFASVLLPAAKMKFDCTVTPCNGEFSLTWLPTQQNPADPAIEITCTPKNNPAVCNAALGATEILAGIDYNALAQLATENYDQVKSKWYYPDQKNFAIYIHSPPHYPVAQKIIGGAEPLAQANIFVRELNYWLVKDTTRTPATINLRVW